MRILNFEIPRRLAIGALVGVLVLAGGGLRFFVFKKEPSYRMEEVRRMDIKEEVQSTGEVVPERRVVLKSEVQGIVKEIAKKGGEAVEKDDLIVGLKDRDALISLQEARADFNNAVASLDKVLAGATREEIRVYEEALEEAETALSNARQDLEDTTREEEEELNSSYEDGLNTLEEAGLKAENAFMVADDVRREYFLYNDQESLRVKDAVASIEREEEKVEDLILNARESKALVETGLEEAKASLSVIYDDLKEIREQCEAPRYRGTVSSTYKTSLDNQKSYINTMIGSVSNSIQTIKKDKIDKESAISTARGMVEAKEKAVKSAEASLEKVKAPARPEDISLARANVDSAQAKLSRAQENYSKTKIESPCRGVVAEVKKEEGETVSQAEEITSVICEGAFEVKVDIPETDIGKIGVGDPAEVSLAAFSERVFEGEVVSVDPAETIIQGVVYYRVTVIFEDEKEIIKPGMTADVNIITEVREDVLAVPGRAITEKDGKKFVKVLKEKEPVEVEVETGIRDIEANTEIRSGLSAGDKVITFIVEE